MCICQGGARCRAQRPLFSMGDPQGVGGARERLGSFGWPTSGACEEADQDVGIGMAPLVPPVAAPAPASCAMHAIAGSVSGIRKMLIEVDVPLQNVSKTHLLSKGGITPFVVVASL